MGATNADCDGELVSESKALIPLTRFATVPVLDLREDAAIELRRLGLTMPYAREGSSEDNLRRHAIPTWLGRMRNEHGSARVFRAMSQHAASLGFDAFAEELLVFADEELHHGVLCGAVATALGGTATIEALPEAPYPWHNDAKSENEALLRNVISVSCLSETVAVTLIGAELEEMEAEPLQSPIIPILKGIWADEIGHSRVGWRFLHQRAAGLDAESRHSLGRYISHALQELVRHELAHLPLGVTPPQGGARYGLCSGSDARKLLQATIDDVILPSLALAGLRPE